MSSFLNNENNVMFVQDYIVSQCNSFLLDSPADVAIATVQGLYGAYMSMCYLFLKVTTFILLCPDLT